MTKNESIIVRQTKWSGGCGATSMRRVVLVQESRAVAKITARCAQCMGDLKSEGFPEYAYGNCSGKFLWAFVHIDPVNVSAEFDVRGFIHS